LRFEADAKVLEQLDQLETYYRYDDSFKDVWRKGTGMGVLELLLAWLHLARFVAHSLSFRRSEREGVEWTGLNEPTVYYAFLELVKRGILKSLGNSRWDFQIPELLEQTSTQNSLDKAGGAFKQSINVLLRDLKDQEDVHGMIKRLHLTWREVGLARKRVWEFLLEKDNGASLLELQQGLGLKERMVQHHLAELRRLRLVNSTRGKHHAVPLAVALLQGLAVQFNVETKQQQLRARHQAERQAFLNSEAATIVTYADESGNLVKERHTPDESAPLAKEYALKYWEEQERRHEKRNAQTNTGANEGNSGDGPGHTTAQLRRTRLPASLNTGGADEYRSTDVGAAGVDHGAVLLGKSCGCTDDTRRASFS
jgi:predicted DNA-binding transcriptional regulator